MPQPADQTRREIWIARMQRFHTSDLNVIEFCQREGVSTPSFYKWKKQLGAAARPTADAVPKFVPVHVAKSHSPVLVNLPGGTTVELPADVGHDQLRQLISACIAATSNSSDSEVRG